MLHPQVSKRGIIVILALVLIASLGQFTLAQDMTYTEAPVLASLVDAGELPPVAERLPVNPQVTTPLGDIGQYGGDLKVGFVGNNPFWGGLVYVTGWEMPVAWKPDFSGVEPNIFADWEVSDDVTQYTFFLREGLKWSDGQPFTADDIMFYIDDVLFNETLTPGGPETADWLPSESANDFVAEKLDDYTVRFTFGQPNGIFLMTLAQWQGRAFSEYPAHFMQQFHADYNPDIEDLVAAEDGIEDWVGLFNKYGAIDAYMFSVQNPDMLTYTSKPTLNPWVLVEELGSGTSTRFERNPYYFKVDTEGQQLPYADAVVGMQFQDAETRTLAQLNGDIDYHVGPGGGNRPLYFEAMQEGRPIAMSFPVSSSGNTVSIHFNRTIDDPVLAEVFADINFRIGMSHAINRPEIIEILYFGQGEPAQVAPLESSPFYNEQLAYQYIEYDVELANEYLDMVLPERDSDGNRLGPDGTPFSFVLTVAGEAGSSEGSVGLAELLIGYWEAVGIQVSLNVQSDDLITTTKNENRLEGFIYTGTGGAGVTPLLETRYYVPGSFWGVFGNGWHYWHSNNPDGVQVEMPPEILEIRQMYENVLMQSSQEAQIEAMAEVLQVAADNFWVLGIARPAPDYHPYNTRVHNIPETWVNGWPVGITKIYRPEQWYLDSE